MLSARRPRLPTRALDRRSTRWPGSRRWRGTCSGNIDEEIERALVAAGPHAGPGRRAVPGRTPTRAPPDRRPGRRRRRRLRAGRDQGGTRNPRAAGVHRRPARPARRPAPRCSSGLPALARPRRRDRQQQLGRRRRALRRPASRCWPTTRTSASACPGSGCRWACTAGPSPPTARSTSPGFTFSGVPGVIIGHNADIAWGFTNLGPDVTDLYLERVTDDEWEHDGRLAAADDPQGDDPGRGGTTSRSPCASTAARADPQRLADFYGDLAEARPTTRPAPAVGPARTEHAVSLAWTALQPRRRPPTRSSTSTPRPTGSFREAASSFAVPAQNIVYADREGHIGYQAPGLVPIRKSGNDGLLPAGGLAQRERLDRRLRAVRRPAQRARPRRGLRRHRQPGGDRPGLPLLPHRRLGPRLPLPADPRPARAADRRRRCRSPT